MLKNDYIMRIVRQFVEMLARLLQLKKEGRYDDAADLLDEVATGLTGLPLATLAQLDAKAIIQLAGDAERAAILARALKEHGELLLLVSEADGGAAAFKAAFLVYDSLERQGQLPSVDGHPECLAWLLEKLP